MKNFCKVLFLPAILIALLSGFINYDKQDLVVNTLHPNGGFEKGVMGWINGGAGWGGGAAFESQTSQVGEGYWSGHFTATALNQYVETKLTIIPPALQGNLCEASLRFYGGSSNFTYTIYDAASSVLATATLSNYTSWTKVPLFFLCPTTSVKARVSASAAGSIYLDSYYVARATLDANTTVSGSIVPSVANTYDIGSSGKPWRTGAFQAVTFSSPLVVSSGGTGIGSLTSGYIPYGNGTSPMSQSSSLQWDGTNLNITGAVKASDWLSSGTGLKLGAQSILSSDIINWNSVFTQWGTSSAHLIGATDIANWNSVFTQWGTSYARLIGATDIANWNSVFTQWGTSYARLIGATDISNWDSVFTQWGTSSAHLIGATDIANWNTTFNRVNQDLKTTDSPSFNNITATGWVSAGGNGVVAGNLAVGKTTAAVRADINGTLKISDGGETASAAGAGAVKWDTATTNLQKSDGSSWVGLGNPPGTMLSMITRNCPAGYIWATGQLLSRTAYKPLYDAVGTEWGTGDNSTTFGMPDTRGIFMRGWGTSGVLSTSNGSLFSGNFGTSGYQNDGFQGHFHTFQGGATAPGPAAYAVSTASNIGEMGFMGNTKNDNKGNGTPRDGPETKPANMSITYCIKY